MVQMPVAADAGAATPQITSAATISETTRPELGQSAERNACQVEQREHRHRGAADQQREVVDTIRQHAAGRGLALHALQHRDRRPGEAGGDSEHNPGGEPVGALPMAAGQRIAEHANAEMLGPIQRQCTAQEGDGDQDRDRDLVRPLDRVRQDVTAEDVGRDDADAGGKNQCADGSDQRGDGPFDEGPSRRGRHLRWSALCRSGWPGAQAWRPGAGR